MILIALLHTQIHTHAPTLTFNIGLYIDLASPCMVFSNRAFSCDVITFKITKENSRHVGVQRDRSFYGDLCEMSDKLIMLLICVESDKIPLLHKLKKLYKCLPVGFLIDIAYTADNILYKLYTKVAVCF